MTFRVKLKWLPTRSNAGEVIDKSYWGDGDELLYTCARSPLSSDFRDFPEWKRTREEDILLTRNGTPYIHLPQQGSIYSNVVQRVSLPKRNRRYIKYALEAETNEFRGYGVSIESFNYQMWGNLKITIHDPKKQIAIADFLDRETSRIDQLISEKQRFLAVLEQKWAATVTSAVTCGLKSEVQLKDTRLSSVGKIPEHWEVARLGHIGRCANGINISGEAFGNGTPFVSYGDVYKNPELPAEVAGLVQATSEDRSRYSVKAGDVFFTRTSETIEEIGFSSVCTQGIPDAVFAGFLIRFRPYRNKLVPLFSKYLFRNEALRAFFSKEMMIVTRASLSQGLLQKLPVLLPPLTEQKEIAAHLQEIESQHLSISQKTSESIERLREYRSALITAAVTGHIDVETRGKSGQTDRRLDQIEEEMSLREART